MHSEAIWVAFRIPNGSIPNVPAGPNGPGCFSNPFSIRAAASKDLDDSNTLESEEFGVSNLALAVPGGFTDVMDIRLGLAGGAVQGRVLKLSSVDPFVVVPLPGASVDLDPDAGDDQSTMTDNSGNYSFPDVPQGEYDIEAEFSGELPVPLRSLDAAARMLKGLLKQPGPFGPAGTLGMLN